MSANSPSITPQPYHSLPTPGPASAVSVPSTVTPSYLDSELHEARRPASIPTSSTTPQPTLAEPVMDELRTDPTAESAKVDKSDQSTSNGISLDKAEAAVAESTSKPVVGNATGKVRHKDSKKRRNKKSSKYTDSSSSSDSDMSDDSSDSSSEDESLRKRRSKKSKSKNKKDIRLSKSKRKSKSKKQESSSSSSDSSSDSSSSDSEAEITKRRKDKKPKSKPVESSSSSSSSSSSNDEDDAVDKSEPDAKLKRSDTMRSKRSSRGSEPESSDIAKLTAMFQQLLDANTAKSKSKSKSKKKSKKEKKAKDEEKEEEKKASDNEDKDEDKDKESEKKKKKGRKGHISEYRRIDQLWDTDIHDWTLKESKDRETREDFDEYAFTVKRVFNWENKYQETTVDIKSKLLRDGLAEVMKDVKGVSLVEDKPSLDPKMLFLYLEEMRTFYRKTLKSRLKAAKKSKHQKKIEKTRKQIKLLVSYLDEDFDETKKKLNPMLKSGTITFEMMWALFKPNTVVLTNTYGASEHRRCFKVDSCNKESSFVKGEWWSVEGRYLEYDGKSFGYGDFESNIEKFPGVRKITSLPAYPLHHHENPDSVRKELIERGKKFVELAGMKYKYHKGLAFHKKKRAVVRLNIDGRCMVDPNMFRRMLPNYPISLLTPKNRDDDESDNEEGGGGCGDCNNGEFDGGSYNNRDDDDSGVRTSSRVIRDPKDGDYKVVEVPVDQDGKQIRLTNHETLGAETTKDRTFTEEELLLASPVVLGFAFSEKQWMEFTVAGIKEIDWNDDAFDSLVIPEDRKSIVKALVSAHKFQASKTIDDVVQGKGRGLVFVLHGPPGCGKTLTCEAIAELLRCPLYSVTAGDLGLSAHDIEQELNRIMQVAQAWGAVLLLDEADVFLEKRQVQDVGRNALVSVFLRLLEYFQGVLFLTTNRVDTFDDAFQSRIHLPLRYEELGFKAKKEIWKLFLARVQTKEEEVHASADSKAAPGAAATLNGDQQKPLFVTFSDKDVDTLARHSLNGRQIKNAVRTAQAIAVHEGARLNMDHIRRVLEVNEAFDRELKGGTGYLDAMRSYT